MNISSVLLMSMPHTEAISKPGFGITVLALTLAVGSAVAGLYFANRRKQWFQNSLLIQGTVTDVYRKYLRDDKSGSRPLYFPTVVFNINGQRFQTIAETGTDHAVAAGQAIDIRYNPQNPAEAIIGSHGAKGLNPNLFYTLGGVMALLAVILVV